MKKLILAFIIILTGFALPQTVTNPTNREYLANVNRVVGLRWTKATDTYTRLGDAEGQSRAYFDNLRPWKSMKRCNISDAGVVTAYYGSPQYIEDGSNGQVVVEMEKYFYKVIIEPTYYEWWVSADSIAGFTRFPAWIRNGVYKDNIYMSAFEGSVYDVTASAIERDSVIVTAEPTADGNLTIVLDGNYSFTVAVFDSCTIETVVDRIVASGAKTAYSGTIWTPTKKDATSLAYVASVAGLKSNPTFSGGTTGVTATIAETVAGTGGYIQNDAGVGIDHTATTGDKLASVAGKKPASGWLNTSLTIANTRILAHNRGAGWEQQDFLTISAIELLYLIEYGSFYSQSLLSAGVTAITDDAATNMAIETGYTGSRASGSQLGNASGEVTVTHYQTAQSTKAFSYRGIENWYGNLWKFTDGINIKADRQPWIADNGFVSDTYASPYVNTGLTLGSTDGYVTDIAVNNSYGYMFLPSAVGGSSSTKLTDYYYQNTDNRIVLFGGSWFYGGSAGGFPWHCYFAASFVYRYIGGRLLFIP